MIIGQPVLSLLAAGVTTWPREGVVLLIVIIVLFAAATVWANVRGPRAAAPAPADQALGLIYAPLDEATAPDDGEDRELQEIYDV